MEEPLQESSDKNALGELFKNRTFWIVYTSTIALFGGGIKFIYDFGKDNGRTQFDEKKIILFNENTELKKKDSIRETKVRQLERELEAALITLNLTQNDKTTNRLEKDPAYQAKNKVHVPAKTSKTTDVAQRLKSNSRPDNKLEDLQIQLDFYIDQNKNLIDENDNLKSNISMMQQKLQRAREMEQKLISETDNQKKSLIARQRDELLAKVEIKMKELLPPNTPIPRTKTDTVKIVEKQSIIDYEKIGDASFDQAMELDNKLRTQPDNYFWGLKKNKTKADFISSALNSYTTALENYKLANNKFKIQKTEVKIKEFKNKFNIE